MAPRWMPRCSQANIFLISLQRKRHRAVDRNHSYTTKVRRDYYKRSVIMLTSTRPIKPEAMTEKCLLVVNIFAVNLLIHNSIFSKAYAVRDVSSIRRSFLILRKPRRMSQHRQTHERKRRTEDRSRKKRSKEKGTILKVDARKKLCIKRLVFKFWSRRLPVIAARNISRRWSRSTLDGAT